MFLFTLTLSFAKQVWAGKMDTVIKTIEHNVRLARATLTGGILVVF